MPQIGDAIGPVITSIAALHVAFVVSLEEASVESSLALNSLYSVASMFLTTI